MTNQAVPENKSVTILDPVQYLEKLQHIVGKTIRLHSGDGNPRWDSDEYEPIRPLTAQEYWEVLKIAREAKLPLTVSIEKMGFGSGLNIHSNANEPKVILKIIDEQWPEYKAMKEDKTYDNYQMLVNQEFLSHANSPENLELLDKLGLERPKDASYYVY